MAFTWRCIAAPLASLAVAGSLMVSVAYADGGVGSESLAIGSPQVQEEGAVQASYVDTEGVVLFDSFVDDEYSDDPDLARYTNKLGDVEYAKTAHDDGHKYYVPVKLVKYIDGQGVVYYFAARPDDGTARLSLVDDAPAIVADDGSLSEAMVDVNVPARLSVGEDEFTVTSIGAGGGSKYIGDYEGVPYNNYSAANEIPQDGKVSPYLLSSYYDTSARDRWWQKNKGPNWPEHYFFGSLGGGMNVMNEGYRTPLTSDQDNSESNTQVFSDHVRSVSIPSTVEDVGHRAFWHFSSESVSFGSENSKLRVLNEQAFEENNRIEEIVLPDGIKQLGTTTYKTFNNITSADQSRAAYYNENGLLGRYVSGEAPNNGYTTTNPDQIVGSSSREIGKTTGSVFISDQNLRSINFPDSLVSIGPAVLHGTSIDSLEIPSCVSKDELNSVFSGMDSLSIVSVGESNNELMSYESVVYSEDGKTVQFVPNGLTTIVGTPSSYTNVSKGTFSNNKKLSSVTLSEGVTTIEESAFSNCSSLELVKMPQTITTIGDYAFTGCSNLATVELPESIASIGAGAFSETGLVKIVLPEKALLGNSVVSASSNLQIAELGLNASAFMFRACDKLKAIVFRGSGSLELPSLDQDSTKYGVICYQGARSRRPPKARTEGEINLYIPGDVKSINDADNATFKTNYFLTEAGLNVYGASDAVKDFFTNSDGSINTENVSLKANGADVAVTYTDISDKIVKIGEGSDAAKAEGLPAEGDSTEYTGSAITFDGITLKYGDTTLVEGTDYAVEYANNMKPGTATVTVTGMGDYVGTMTGEFTISDTEDRKAAADEDAAKALVAAVAALPDADEITADKPDAVATVEDAVSAYCGMNDAQKAEIGVDTLSALVAAQAKAAEVKQQIADEALQAEKEAKEAAQKEAAEAKAQAEQLKADVEAAKASAAASASLAKPALTAKTKSKKKGKVTVAWGKVAGASGYEVKVGSKTYTVKGAAKLSKTVKAKKGKKVKVQVRAFKKQGDNTVYSSWSAAKKVKVRK